jgi:putative DNA primase/helicase
MLIEHVNCGLGYRQAADGLSADSNPNVRRQKHLSMVTGAARAHPKREPFSPAEVAAYYLVRLPNRELQGDRWRVPCPIHNGNRNSFAVNPQTGDWFCHSQCGRGGDIYKLQMELTGCDFKTAAAEVDRIVGRQEPARTNGRTGGRRIVATYDYVDELGRLLFQCLRHDPKNFTQRRPDGRGGWIWNLKGVRRVLYRLPKLKDADQIFVVEGERDVHTVESLGLTGTCNPMGAGKWMREYSESLRGKKVVIICDADEPGRKHAATISQDLLEVDAEVRSIELPGAKDVSDWVDRGGTIDQLAALINCAKPLSKQTTDSMANQLCMTSTADSFELTSDSLYKLVNKDGEIQRVYLCGRLEVLSLTRDMRGDNWGKQLLFRDADGKIHDFVMPETLLASRQGEWFSQLKSRGLFISARNDVRGHLLNYLCSGMPTARTRTVDQVGWHGDVFVTPNWSVPSETSERIVLDDQSIGQHFFGQRGTLQQWKDEVSSLSRNNPLLIFALSAGFAPILLSIKQGLGGGFHLASNSGTGKTTVLRVAGSVWGGGGKLGFVQSWNATANGVEAMAQGHNHALLLLDELKELPADQAARSAYQLANGQGRQTMDRNRARRSRQTWDLIFLSNGELDFITHILAAEKRAYAGQEVRVCPIPADRGKFGAFDCIHACTDGGAFAQTIGEASNEYFGTAAPAFITQYLKIGRPAVRCEVDRIMGQFVADNQPSNAAPEVGRVLQRFALIAAAGELATKWLITAWRPGEATISVSTVFKSWLNYRGTAGSFDEKQALQHVRDYLLQFGPSRFQRHHAGKVAAVDAKISNRVGFINEGADGLEYQFLDHLPREFCGQFTEELVLQAVDSIGALIKEADRRTVKRVLPDCGSRRCYVISQRLLFPDTED